MGVQEHYSVQRVGVRFPPFFCANLAYIRIENPYGFYVRVPGFLFVFGCV